MKQSTAFALALFFLAGCGGGGGSSSVPGNTAKAQPQSVTGSVVISIPSSSSQSSAKVRYPQFVSPNAQSVALSVNGGTDQLFNVASGSSLCTTGAGGARNCTLTFGAPAGSDSFAFLIWSGPNGTGTVLASAGVTQVIAAGVAFNFTVALNAAIGTVIANIPSNGGTQGNCPNGLANFNAITEGCAGSSGAVTFTVDDPSGATVTGTAPFATPITITTNDPSVTASPNQITAPGQTTVLTYTGAALGAAITNSIAVNLTIGTSVIPLSVQVRRSYLYVANSNAPIGMPPSGGGNVSVYTYGASGNPTPVREITGALTTLQTPTKPLVDSSGNLYVIDNGIPVGGNFNASIDVFGPTANGNVAPTRAITGMSSLTNVACSDMVFDPSGQYLVVACGSEIQVFPIGASGIASSAMTAQMYDDSADTHTALAFDNSGNLYISDDSYNAIFFAAANTIRLTGGGYYGIGGTGTMTGGSASWPATLEPQYIVIDNAGTLYAPFFYLNPTGGLPDAVAELGIWKTTAIPCPNCAPSAFLNGAPFTTHAVTGVAIDPAGNLYVDNIMTNQINVFAAATVAAASSSGTTAPILRTITNTSNGTSTGALGMTIAP